MSAEDSSRKCYSGSPEELKSIYNSKESETTRLGTTSGYSLRRFDPNEAMMHQKMMAQQSQRVLKQNVDKSHVRSQYGAAVLRNNHGFKSSDAGSAAVIDQYTNLIIMGTQRAD